MMSLLFDQPKISIQSLNWRVSKHPWFFFNDKLTYNIRLSFVIHDTSEEHDNILNECLTNETLKIFDLNNGLTMAIFILEGALSVWTNLLLVWLFVSSIKTGTKRIIRVDKLFFVVHRAKRRMEDNSSRRIMHLVPVFILETNN